MLGPNLELESGRATLTFLFSLVRFSGCREDSKMNKWTLFTPTMFLFEHLRRPEMRRMLAMLNDRLPLRPETRVLDVGCGIGSLLLESTRYGCQPTGGRPYCVDVECLSLDMSRYIYVGCLNFARTPHRSR